MFSSIIRDDNNAKKIANNLKLNGKYNYLNRSIKVRLIVSVKITMKREYIPITLICKGNYRRDRISLNITRTRTQLHGRAWSNNKIAFRLSLERVDPPLLLSPHSISFWQGASIRSETARDAPYKTLFTSLAGMPIFSFYCNLYTIIYFLILFLKI